MAFGAKKAGKLDVFARGQYYFVAVIFLQRIDFYILSIFAFYHHFNLWIPRLEKESQHTRNQSTELIKVVLYGPESTGKTTLAKQLAEHYNTHWVPEFMREYLQKKWDNEKKLVEKEDLIPIAKGQLKWEKEASQQVENLLICDTNLLELKVYSEYYYDGFCPPEIKNEATKDNYSIYLLTYIDTPWEADDLRDRPENREEMFRIFEAELKKQGFPYKILKGNENERFNKAVEIIDALLKN